MFFEIDWNSCLDSFYWSYENFCYFVLIVIDQFKLRFCYNKERNEFRLTVRCEHCNFVVYVENWNQKCVSYHENSWKIHVQKSSQCFLIIRYLTDLKKQKQARITKKQKEIRLTIFACKRCFVKFSNNTKLYQHVQNHHQKKIEKFANEFATSTFFFTSKTMIAKRTFIASIAKSTFFAIFTSNEIVISTFFFTSKTKLVKITKSEFAKITSIAIFASISRFLFISKAMIIMFTFFATFAQSNESTLMFILFVNHSKSIFDISFFLISFATSKKSIFWIEIISRSVIASKFSRFSVFASKRISNIAKTASNICSFISQKSKHQHQISYFIIDDLYRMFAEKFKSIDLSRHQIRRIFSSSVDFRQSIQRVLVQIKITFYFKFAINQNKSISQDSKIDEFWTTYVCENDSHYSQQMIWKIDHFIIQNIDFFSSIYFRDIEHFVIQIVRHFWSFISFIYFTNSFRHFRFFSVCRICNDIFEFNNDLHRHLRIIHFDQIFRRNHENFRKHDRELDRELDRNFDIEWRKIESIFYFFVVLLINFFIHERMYQ